MTEERALNNRVVASSWIGTYLCGKYMVLSYLKAEASNVYANQLGPSLRQRPRMAVVTLHNRRLKYLNIQTPPDCLRNQLL
jgi:hypothetical protein